MRIHVHAHPHVEGVYDASGYRIVKLAGDINQETVAGDRRFAEGTDPIPGYFEEFDTYTKDASRIKPPFGLDLTNCAIKDASIVYLMHIVYVRNSGKYPVVCNDDTKSRIARWGGHTFADMYGTADDIPTFSLSERTAPA